MDLFGSSSGGGQLAAWPPTDWGVAAGWLPVVEGFFESAVGQGLSRFLGERLATGAVVYPPEPLRALALTAPADVRVVVVGQDPYHGPGQAEGLAFSVAPGVKVPPSLRNIYLELGVSPPPRHGRLVSWAEQGVLLLNTTLTVEDGQPASHAKRGWEVFTDAVLQRCNAEGGRKVFLLWGGHAQAKAPMLDAQRHLVLQANHPSPLSARRGPVPFIGCGHFEQANRWLEGIGQKPVQWL
jgi:uracil-DNA glycosylase